jgi:hypothetical protein
VWIANPGYNPRVILRRKWRPILATALVLAFAIFAYLHSVPATIDLNDIPDPVDPKHPLVTDLPVSFTMLDGQRVAVDGYMIPMDEVDHQRRIGIVTINFFQSTRGWPSNQLIGTNWNPASYTHDNIRVTGQFHIRSDIVEGYVVSFDQIDVEQIETIYTGPTATWPWAAIGITLALASAIPKLRRAHARRNLRRVGHCTRCGYDLCATPARCPECGLAPEAP